jgi:hypothetical protein
MPNSPKKCFSVRFSIKILRVDPKGSDDGEVYRSMHFSFRGLERDPLSLVRTTEELLE